MEEAITAYELLGTATTFSGTFRFDTIRYDDATDVVHLDTGVPEASFVESTPEGHSIRISAVEDRLVGVQLAKASERLRTPDQWLTVTIGPGQRLALEAERVRAAVGGRFTVVR